MVSTADSSPMHSRLELNPTPPSRQKGRDRSRTINRSQSPEATGMRPQRENRTARPHIKQNRKTKSFAKNRIEGNRLHAKKKQRSRTSRISIGVGKPESGEKKQEPKKTKSSLAKQNRSLRKEEFALPSPAQPARPPTQSVSFSRKTETIALRS